MAKKTTIYSVDIYAGILQGIDNELLASQILSNHQSGNLSLIPDEIDRANKEEDSTLPETTESNKLIKEILIRVSEVINEFYSDKKYNIVFNPVMDNVRMIWSHVTYPRESTGYHNHHNKNDINFLDLSCVYYVKTPKKCGNLFFNPISHNQKTYSIEPQEGLLVIFPSWLNHFCPKNLSKEPRISISANFYIEELL